VSIYGNIHNVYRNCRSDRRAMLHLSCASWNPPRIRTIMQQVVSLEYLRLIHGSIILDNIWTQFLGGATYTWERLIGEYIQYINEPPTRNAVSTLLGLQEGS